VVDDLGILAPIDSVDRGHSGPQVCVSVGWRRLVDDPPGSEKLKTATRDFGATKRKVVHEERV
jgi:hypothetical protein